MPRCAREKSPDGIYHVIVRGLSEVQLFKNNKDKDKYLKILKKYQDIYLFKIYAFCIMNTHAHFIIDCNGADISKFMHQINQSYAQYYNKKHKRHGHVFGDRFKSILIKNSSYLYNLSAYIHNNPKDIKNYKNNVEKYKYSSFSNYIGINNNKCFVTVDTNFILQNFNKDLIKSRQLYFNFVKSRLNKDIPNDGLMYQPSEYRCEKIPLIRDFKPETVIKYVAKYLKLPTYELNIKFLHKATHFRAICVILFRSLCDMKYKDICALLGNISSSQVSKLNSKGYDLIHENDEYSCIITNFLKEYKVA